MQDQSPILHAQRDNTLSTFTLSNGHLPPTIRVVLTMRILPPFWRGMREHTFYQDFHQGVSEALLELGHYSQSGFL